LELLGFDLQGWWSYLLTFIAILIVIQIEKPLRLLFSPSWRIAVLNVMLLITIPISAAKVRHTDDGKDELRFSVGCSKHHP
jgi:hypothetical protein